MQIRDLKSCAGLRRSRTAPDLASFQAIALRAGDGLGDAGVGAAGAPPPNLRRAPAIVPAESRTNCKVDMRRMKVSELGLPNGSCTRLNANASIRLRQFTAPLFDTGSLS